MKEKNLYVVGIGSSAGGMDALKEFFTHLPENPGLTFVVIYHLLPHVPSLPHNILALHTPLKVTEATDDTLLEPNCIYLIPANKLLTIQNKRLKVSEYPREHLFPMTIDIFLHSLGNELKDKAVGIILSGAGNDGSNGVQTIHEHGGMVMVQNPDTARFDDMPSIAIAADHPDWVMSPSEMGAKLIEYIQNPQVLRDKSFKINTGKDNEILQDIIQLVSDFSGVNFKHYKLNPILRRMERRMNINQIFSIIDYQKFLHSHPEELRILYHEMLNGVGNFFRDPHAFQALVEKVLPELGKRRAHEPIRIWVAGCSTGVEAYSLAILFDEYIQKNKLDVDYKIFATDLDSRAIEFASYGRYRNTIATEVDSEWLQKYFIQTGDFYEVRKEIRRKIIFAKHNLISDPPFIRLDLLTCHNLLTYLKADVQKKLAKSFRYALKPLGYLFMGAQELPNEVESVFELVDHQWKIFRNKAGNRYQHPATQQPDLDHFNIHLPASQKQKPSQLPASTYPTQDRYTELLLNQYAPTCLFVNHNHEITYMNGQVERYLQLPRKRVSFYLYQLVPENLSTIFRAGIRKVRQGEANVAVKNVPITKQGLTFKVNLTFKKVIDPDKEHSNGASLVLIEIIEMSQEVHSAIEYVTNSIDGTTAAEKEIFSLGNELQEAKKEWLYTIDELETINEELQVSNEELQSSNEELFTVNTELKEKIDELTLLHNGIKNLLVSTGIATIFLDRKLNIWQFTPSAKAHFNILDSDIGRPLSHLTHHFDYNGFAEDSEEVLQKQLPLEREISKKTGLFYILRILPYRTEDSQIIGVVITIVDVTELKESNLQLLQTARHLQSKAEELLTSEQKWKSLVDNMPDFVIRFDRQVKHMFVNKAVERELGIDLPNIVGKSIEEVGVLSEADAHDWMSQIKTVFETQKPFNYYQEVQIRGDRRYLFTKLIPEFDLNRTQVESVLSVSRDISVLKQIETELKHSEANWRSLVSNTPDLIFRFGKDLKHRFANEALEKEFGIKASDILGKTSLEAAFPAKHEARVLMLDLKKVFKTGRIINHYTFVERQGQTYYLFIQLVPEFESDGKTVACVLTIARDITTLKNYEIELNRKNQELQRINEYLDNFVYAAAHDLQSPVVSLKILTRFINDPEHLDNQPMYVNRLGNEVDRLEKTLGGLVELVRVQSIEDTIRVNSFQSILEQVKAEFEEMLKETDAHIETHFEAYPKVAYLQAFLLIIFRNLLSNALKYRLAKHPLQITISTEKINRFVLLRFQDNGQGIDLKKNGKHLFKPFKQLSHKVDGIGLGLHLVKYTVEQNGGRIEVESNPGQGTTFLVYLHEYK
jgi:two-component system CheB/CheR fusion protein